MLSIGHADKANEQLTQVLSGYRSMQPLRHHDIASALKAPQNRPEWLGMKEVAHGYSSPLKARS